MFVERFIASRLSGTIKQKSFSNVIVRLAIASVALSVTVMIVSSSMINGFKKEISQKIFDFWGHMQITDISTNPLQESTPMQLEPALLDSLTDIDRIYYEWPMSILGYPVDRMTQKRTKGGVKYAYPYIQFPVVLTTAEDMEGIIMKGVGQQFPDAFEGKYLMEGRMPALHPDSTSRGIVVSQMTASRLQLELGDQLRVYFVVDGRFRPRRYEVVGIYKTGLAEYDKRISFLSIYELQHILDWSTDQVSGIEVVLDDIEDIDIMTAFVDQEVLPPNLYSRSIKDKSSNIFDWLELQNINEVLILGLMLVVCIINMITSLLILILERTHMIGILKALGGDNWLIRKIFIRQAAQILIYGLVIGNVLGLMLCFLQKRFEFIKLHEEDYYLAVAPIDFNFWVIILINVGTLLVTILFLILPSYFISRITPTKAIRFS